jgi:hypothetical protein
MSATLISLLSPLVAVVIAVWSFRRTSKADRLRAFFDLQARYLSPDLREGRSLIHGMGATPASDLGRAAATKIGTTLAVMNSIAIATEGGYVDRELVSRSMGRSYASAIRAAKPYIDHVESVRGFRPFPFAERLADRLITAGHDVG